jgi:hypothetical protein
MPKPKSQIQKFHETARALECDESEVAFNRALKKIAKTPPTPQKGSKIEPKKPRR